MNQPHAASAPQPDRFYYEITLPESNRHASVAEHDLPTALTPLVEMLAKAGTVGKGAGGSTRP